MQTNITLIYFIYGLAFFCMGIVILLESSRSPLLANAKSLLPLALFGFIHGIHEWLELALINQYISNINPTGINWLRIGVLATSFIFLFFFSLRALSENEHLLGRELIFIAIIITFYIIIVTARTRTLQQSHTDWYLHLDAFTRYLLAIPAACLAGFAFIRKAAKARHTSQYRLMNILWLVAIGFFGYAITQSVVPAADYFPSNIWNTQFFLSLTGVPIQLFRAGFAVIITVGLLRASQLIAGERQDRLKQAETAQLIALQQVRVELEAKEKLRSELIRRTVIAQEEERTRIARELHDETSQILAAISLQLESLRASSNPPAITKQVDELQVLRRRIADGIYRLMHDLRPAQLDDLGLTAALRSLVDDMKRHMDVTVELRINGEERRLEHFTETVLFRVAQEALTNVARHADVGEAAIVLIYSAKCVEINISDHGRGFSLKEVRASSRGWGHVGMQERVEAATGDLDIQSSPSNGTTITATIPTAEIENQPGRSEPDHELLIEKIEDNVNSDN